MGHNEYMLKSLADDQLLSGLAGIVRQRNQVTAEFLAYLAELDERQLFLDLGFSSLFQYCVETLKLCESTAGRHIAAARVCRNYPKAFALVTSGALHASALSLLKKHLTPENAAELFDLCQHRSSRRVEELLAARFPRPDVRDSVRRLPRRAGVTLNVERPPERHAEQAPVGSASCAASNGPTKAPIRDVLREASAELEPARFERLSSSGSGELGRPAKSVRLASFIAQSATVSSKSRRIEPLSTDRYGVHFTADGEFCALLERVRGLAGHRLPSGDLLTLLKRGLAAYERELERERFAVGKPRRREGAAPVLGTSARKDSKPELTSPNRSKVASRREPLSSSKRKRSRSAAVIREVFLRDGKQCSYVSPDGRRCGARRLLEVDHIEPLAVGGEDTVENLRLRCRAHNQRYARQCFGTSRIKAAIRAFRQRRDALRA
jgi:5-methylcytosine-specific restriction endonuclease McrA